MKNTKTYHKRNKAAVFELKDYPLSIFEHLFGHREIQLTANTLKILLIFFFVQGPCLAWLCLEATDRRRSELE